MDELCIRFSHLSEKIFDSLDNDSITKCKEVSRFWFNYLDGQKLVQIRIIKAKVKQFYSIGEAWNNVFNSASTETIMTLGVAVNQFYKKDLGLDYHEGLTPIHVAAATGHLLLLTKLQEKTLDKHPKDIKGCTPLYYAAQNGHLEVCEYLIQKFEDNNSAENVGTTPLQMAAKNGHFKDCELMTSYTPLHQAAGFGHGSVEIYMLLSNHLTNKNPSSPDGSGWTPLHMAACKGHLKICEFIMDSLVNKNPANVFNLTPLHVAAIHGNTNVCALILENVQNKTPMTQDGKTPAMLAIENNHYELGQLLKDAGKVKSSEYLAT